MKSKLTLSLPTKTIEEAKMIAKQRHVSVSRLFAESLGQWKSNGIPQPEDEEPGRDSQGSMDDLLGVFSVRAPFDARSAQIRKKHE